MDNQPVSEVSPVRNLLSEITAQIQNARGGDAVGEVSLDQIAQNFQRLRELNATEEESLQEDVRIQTMHNMVQSVTLGNQGRRSNLMFLPNKQGAYVVYYFGDSKHKDSPPPTSYHAVVLFLTHPVGIHEHLVCAARMLSENESGIHKIFAAFKMKEPTKLIINLLHDTNGVFENGLDEYVPRDVVPPTTAWGTAFETEQKANEAFFRLVRFMMEVVIPLAAETNALILCSACESILSRALLEALSNTDSTVSDQITVFGFAAQVSTHVYLHRQDAQTLSDLCWHACIAHEGCCHNSPLYSASDCLKQ